MERDSRWTQKASLAERLVLLLTFKSVDKCVSSAKHNFIMYILKVCFGTSMS